jgi:hypothetical protein
VAGSYRNAGVRSDIGHRPSLRMEEESLEVGIVTESDPKQPRDAKDFDDNILVTKVDWLLNWARKSSLFMFSFGLA